MYRWQIFALLLLSSGGVISLTLASVFQVFSIPLETVDVGGYCDRLADQLTSVDSSIILLQVGRPSKAFEVVSGDRNTTTASRCEFLPSDTRIGEDPNALDLIVQQIQDDVIAVKRHHIVEYITLLTADGEYLLTLERTGDLEEPIGLEPKFGGVSAKEKLLLSLVGGGSGGRVKSFEQLKKP
ncbi:uncharacterized protein LOC126559193 [Anopheles maculipalpis]|uniref:uncharacterized protein LOC126559193 n=1 Tax=Anopheles maculipalpis TaxID=1496333 RepID=UPI002158A8A5|nr:uncharacterized protein LOC126559193 [Anopheles maculipalpis]